MSGIESAMSPATEGASLVENRPPDAVRISTERTDDSFSPVPGKIKVMRVIDRLNVGGPAKHVTWLSAGMDAGGFETLLITGVVPPGEGDMSGFAREAGVAPLVIEEMSRELSWRDAVVVVRLLRELWKHRPQVVHTHKAKAGAVGRSAAFLYRWLTPGALLGRPRQCLVVHTYHGHIFHSYYGPLKTKLFVAIERALARLCTDAIITISEQQRREINEEFGVGRREQFRVIPLGINFAEYERPGGSLRADYGLSEDDFLIGLVGRLCEVKNITLLLEAARLLQEESAAAVRLRFIVVGDGHLREALEQRARELSVSERVIFTGFRDDAAALYGQLDLVVLTSLNEGTPLTLIEAMYHGRAVVSTEVGGVVDLMGRRQELSEGVESGRDAAHSPGLKFWEHGITTPSRDAEALARAIRIMAEHSALRRQMGERSSEFVRRHYSKDRLVREVGALYREMAGHGRPSRAG